MLQSVLLAPGKIGFRQEDTPTPSRGELLVKVEVALTCGTDVKAFLRGHPVIPMPGPFGHEFSGTVAAAGRGVRGFGEGDRIMSVHSAPCLKCGFCRKGRKNLCEHIMDTKVMGAFADYILLPEHIVRQNAYKIPPRLGFAEAALLEPLSCVVHGTEPLGIKRGQSALVLGAGPIGLMHTMLLKLKGAYVVLADVNPARLMQAERAGADRMLDPRGSSSGDIRALSPSGAGFDYAFECTGRPEVWERSVDYLCRGGTLVLFGGCPTGSRVTYDTGRLHYDEITLKGVFHFTPEDVRLAHRLLCGRRLDASWLISGTYPLGRLGDALEAAAGGKGIKYAIVPG